jgi:GR25 family glycosyltransferase involved in LPS biosynthesis
LINLDKRQDRLERFDTQAKALGIEYERLQAVEATDPIMGCKLSHIAALSKYDSGVIFVFEDDSAFVDNFWQELEASMNSLPDDWDMVYLGANLVDTTPINDRWHKSRRCCSTHAYAVKAEVVPRLIAKAKEYDGHVDMAFSLLHPELNVYLARPTLVYQEPGYSDLMKENVDYARLYF